MQNAFADANRYRGQELDDLRAAISALNGVRPEQITLGCGSGDLLRIAAETHCGPGKSLVMATPTFNVIAGFAGASGTEIRTVPLTKAICPRSGVHAREYRCFNGSDLPLQSE
jgi:histidinol-phosphate aminotransferase